MADFLLVVIAAFVAAGIVFAIAVLATGGDPGLAPADPDRRPRTLPRDRPLAEPDVAAMRFDTAVRGYRMADVDEALRRLGYDIGYKVELIRVMEAELAALRAGEVDQANELCRMRMVALGRVEDATGGGAGERATSPAVAAGEPETPVAGTEPRDESPGGQAAAEQAVAIPPDDAGAAPDGKAAQAPAGAPADEPDGVGSRRR